jgi:hypothetical protein
MMRSVIRDVGRPIGSAIGVPFGISKTVSDHPDLGLHASSIEWIDDTHIRVTYDWSDDDQLLDFTGLSDSGFTRDSGDNSITITNGTQDIDGIMWKQPIKCSRIFVSSGMPLSGRSRHLNIYTALSPLYTGRPWNANPSITAISDAQGTHAIRWVVDGAYGNFEPGYYIENDVPNSIEFIIANDGYDVTYIRLSDSLERSFHLTRDLSSPLSVFGMIAFGAYQTDTKWKTITIEGEIELPDPPLPPSGESMIFVSEGATFSPVIEVEDGTSVLWEFDDETTSTAVNPTVDYGTAGSRQNKLTVTPWSGLIGINIGYDGSDGGWATPANLAQQNVSSIISLSLAAASLTYFTCNHNANLTSLDFTGFDKLIQLEAYNAGLININLTGCTALRRLCLETCELIALDVSDCVALEDLRGALNNFDYINFGSIGANIWHICVRDNAYSSNLPHPRQFPLLREYFLWASQQTGHLDMSENPRCSSVQVYNNQYTSADFRGAFTVNVGSINIRNNLLTSLLVSNCPTLSTLDASNNNLSDEAVCQVLIDMDNNGRENGTLNLSGNSVPTGVDGLAALDSLRLKDWDVTVDTV